MAWPLPAVNRRGSDAAMDDAPSAGKDGFGGCPNCGGRDLYVTKKPISSGGGYAPDLLPGLHAWFRAGKLMAVLCADCGLYRQFADSDARARVRSSPKWQKL